MTRAIDCWVNVAMAEMGRPEYLKTVARDYFKQGDDFFRNYSVEEMLATGDSDRSLDVGDRPVANVDSDITIRQTILHDRAGDTMRLQPTGNVMTFFVDRQ